MNFPEQSNFGGHDYQPAPERRGGCGSRLVLFLIVFGIAMFLFRSPPQQPKPPGPDRNDRPIGSTTPEGGRNPIGTLPRDANKRRGDADDWSIEEVKSTGGTSDNNKTNRGDWSIEEVETRAEKSIQLNAGEPAAPKRTEKGDWSVEEVPEKKKPARVP